MSAMIVQLKDGQQYDQEKIEYIPGPWFGGDKDTKFQSAYATDALAAGYTLEQAHALRKKIEAEAKLSSPESKWNLCI